MVAPYKRHGMCVSTAPPDIYAHETNIPTPEEIRGNDVRRVRHCELGLVRDLGENVDVSYAFSEPPSNRRPFSFRNTGLHD